MKLTRPPMPTGTAPRRPMRMVKAIHDYQAKDTQELSLQKGDIIHLQEGGKNSPWGRGFRNSDGKEGWFPMTFVEVFTSAVPSLRQKKLDPAVLVDDSSILENKIEIKSDLDSRLKERPDRKQLCATNILPGMEVDASLIVAQKKLERSRKIDFLTNFLRIRREKEHKLKPPLKIYKTEINFDNKVCDANDTIEDSFDIKNREFSRLKWRIDCNVYNQPFVVTFEPSSGRLSAKKKDTIKVKVTIKNLTSRDFPVYLMSGTDKLGELTMKIRCNDSYFGTDPLTLEMQRDEDGLVVPKILLQLQSSLRKYDAFSKEGIFRLAGEATNISQIRKRLDKKEFVDDPDVFSVATLVKVWYRELPNPVLSKISKEKLLAEDPVECFTIIDTELEEPAHSLMQWLVKMIHECTNQSAVNKMTIENMAICVAPNLYRLSNDVDPVEGLVISQKAAKFVCHAIEGYQTLLKNSKPTPFSVKGITGSKVPPPLPSSPKPELKPKPRRNSNNTPVDMKNEIRDRANTII